MSSVFLSVGLSVCPQGVGPYPMMHWDKHEGGLTEPPSLPNQEGSDRKNAPQHNQ